MENLIEKYLRKELTEAELLELHKWLEKSTKNRRYFENIVSHWTLLSDDIKDSKTRVLQKIHTTAPESGPYMDHHDFRRTLFKVAAVITLGVAILFTAWKLSQQPFQGQQVQNVEKFALPGQKLSFKLPDGSLVKLNSGSKLSFPSAFSSVNRKVILSGEAFFEVVRDTIRPFMIQTQTVNVQVLGTSFDVKSYENESEVLVAVKSGLVEVSSNANPHGVVVAPDELVIYDKQNLKLNKGAFHDDMGLFAWTEQTLVFNNLVISDMLKTLSRWYNVQFAVQGDLDQLKRFTGRYKNPSLKEVMESLAYAYEFDYTIEDEKVIIMNTK